MDNLTEQEFYRNVVKPAIDPWGEHDRIENGIGEGLPDIAYAFSGVQGWIEMKVAKNSRLYFRRFQIPWLVKRSRHAAHVWVLALAGKDLILINACAFRNIEKGSSGRYTTVHVDTLRPHALLTGKIDDSDKFWPKVLWALIKDWELSEKGRLATVGRASV